MCTAVTHNNGGFYFGRTLDHHTKYGEEIVLMPRRYPLSMRSGIVYEDHYAVIGMAHVAEGYPLYYDAMNEKGLAAAALNFPSNAHYERAAGEHTVTHFEFLPYVLAMAASASEAVSLISAAGMSDEAFAEGYPVSDLHYIIADRERSFVIEPVFSGLKIYENPVGVLTNNPPFAEQLNSLGDYMTISPMPPQNKFSDRIKFNEYSLGMGAIGLPGDNSSKSRFVRCAFNLLNIDSEAERGVSEVFHVLSSVEVISGSVITGSGARHKTIYTSCCDCDGGTYYYTTYSNRRITGVKMKQEDMIGQELCRWPLLLREDIRYLN